MVNRLLRGLSRWTAVESVLARIAGQFTTWPADDFGKFVSASIGTGMAGGGGGAPPPPRRSPGAPRPADGDRAGDLRDPVHEVALRRALRRDVGDARRR